MGQITEQDVLVRGGKVERQRTRLELAFKKGRATIDDVLRSWWAPAALAVAFSVLGVRFEYAIGAVVVVLAPQALTAIRLARGEPRQGAK